jgi:ribonuclease P/MRP protein subunit POP5
MKLKILPPTIRQKKRYITIKLYSENEMAKEECVQVLWNSTLNTYGEVESSMINLWLIDFIEVENDNRFEYNCIVRCNRGYEQKALTAFHTITNFRKNKIVVHPLSTSGTIKGLEDKF